MTTQSPSEVVRSGPFWRVLIRPASFVPERIKTLKECWELVESCRVALRGWDYPHVDRENRENGSDWIASWVSFGRHQEYWRFFQSAQFVHVFSFEEDAIRKKAEERAQESIDWRPDGFQASGYLEVNWTTFRITEIFEFASRLGQRGLMGDAVSITISMNQVRDRVLFVMDPMRAWWGFYAATQDVLEKSWSFSRESLMGNTVELALDAVFWFFERFGWMDPPREVFSNDQKKLLERRL